MAITNLQPTNALGLAYQGWQSASPTGIIGHVPAFQPPLVQGRQVWNQLATRLDWLNDEYREAYMEASVEQNIAYQIRFNRQERELTQKQLADEIGTKQSVISRYEDPMYGNFSIASLIKIANVFECALSVKFISYMELARESDKIGKQAFLVKGFGSESHLIERTP
jgi:transcriptional regulator with XRE-family HTH domain